MQRFIAAISFAVLAVSALASEDPPKPFGRLPTEHALPPGRDPRDVRDPLMVPPSGGAPLPPLPSSPGTSQMFRDMQPRPLPGQPASR
jgi:hypothetical protein